MQIIYQSEIEKSAPCVATVGFFDGVHAGHRFLIEELKVIAKKQNQKSVVVTFAVHPRKVLNSEFQPDLLTSLSEKLIQLESTGIDGCVVLDFTLEMAQLSAYEFLKTILKEQLNVHTLLVGHDHRFGHNRTDGFAEYKKYGETLGMDVIQANKFNTDVDQHISSSEIRSALTKGEIESANRLLTYEYSIQGVVVKGFQVGRTIGFPTANIEPEDPEKLIPEKGVYAVRVHWNDLKYKGMLNIGQRPTLDNGQDISIEVYIIDFDADIYNQTLKIDFVHKIRNEQKFNGVEALKEQLQKDRLYVQNMDID
ncbi:MAG: bifunctional riboflavin kinase/FAD synthetase [Bacteroidota bacterium]|nr:bifunctional riboflavin kinase/FAD synthetase [Bacteroidota bacterium]